MKKSWDHQIKPVEGWFRINFKEILSYKGLIFLFVKRDFVVFYKQTILGVFWYIIQPLFSSGIFTFIFGTVAGIPTDGIPPFLFFLAGTVIWGYFSSTFSQTGKTFLKHAQIFGKVYFPRITVPIATALTNTIQFFIQFILFIIILFIYKMNGAIINLNFYVLILPLIILQIMILSIGMGLIVSAVTARYRDLSMAISFFVQLWMFLTPVVYPLSEVPEKFKIYILFNPMTAPVEMFKKAFLGVSAISYDGVIISIIMTLLVFIIGIIFFNRVEKNFMDTV